MKIFVLLANWKVGFNTVNACSTLAFISVIIWDTFELCCFVEQSFCTLVGSPGKNGTYRKSIQRRLIITFIHSYYIVTISKIVVSIVCHGFVASNYSISTLARLGNMLQHLSRYTSIHHSSRFAWGSSSESRGARGSHFYRSIVCTWCRDQNVIKGSRMKLQDNLKIKDRMNRRSCDQDRKSAVKNYFRLYSSYVALYNHHLAT